MYSTMYSSNQLRDQLMYTCYITCIHAISIDLFSFHTFTLFVIILWYVIFNVYYFILLMNIISYIFHFLFTLFSYLHYMKINYLSIYLSISRLLVPLKPLLISVIKYVYCSTVSVISVITTSTLTLTSLVEHQFMSDNS